MRDFEYYALEAQADELAKKIIKRYKSHGVSIDIKDKGITILEDRFKFKIKLLPGTRVDQMDNYAKDVQVALKLPLFQVIQEGLLIFIIASKKTITDNHLFRILTSSEYAEAKKFMQIIHPLGFDATGRRVIADLAMYPHLMLCGTTGSGKSVALKSLLVSIMGGYSPNKVSVLICDRAADLLQFADMPHLASPIIQDFESFLSVMLILKDELERRISLKHSEEFRHLPNIVCVIDEFLAFISGTDDQRKSKLVRDTISDILRRARHAKIHLVLAAHNPTKQNVKIDISDIPTKMAFRVAKFTNSVTVLGESGAEKLRGKGDMLFQSSQNDERQRIQGAYISTDELSVALNQIRSHYASISPKQKEFNRLRDGKYGFRITEMDLQRIETEADCAQIDRPVMTSKQNIDDELLTRIVLWALEYEAISCNKIIETFGVGWPRAKRCLEKLHEFGIVGDIYEKLPRVVLPDSFNDIHAEGMNFLLNSGISADDIATAIQNRNRTQ